MGGDTGVVGTLTSSAARSTSSADIANNVIADRVSRPLLGHGYRLDLESEAFVLAPVPIQDATRGRRSQNGTGIGLGSVGDPSFTLATRSTHAIAFHAKQDPITSDVVSPAVAAAHGSLGVMTFAAQITHPENRERVLPGSPAPCLASTTIVRAISMAMRPRRLTPREWERLQGFPDDYTAIAYKRKPAKDGPRYEALGNSMAVPVMRWIARRLEIVDGLVDFG